MRHAPKPFSKSRSACVLLTVPLLFWSPATIATQAPAPIKKPDVIFVPTPQEVVDKMLELAQLKKGDVLYDLGCGDGRIVVTAAKKYGVKAIGFDVDPQRIKEATENVQKNGVGNLVTIRQADIFEQDLREANVVTLYLLPELNVRLMPQFKQLKGAGRASSPTTSTCGERNRRRSSPFAPTTKKKSTPSTSGPSPGRWRPSEQAIRFPLGFPQPGGPGLSDRQSIILVLDRGWGFAVPAGPSVAAALADSEGTVEAGTGSAGGVLARSPQPDAATINPATPAPQSPDHRSRSSRLEHSGQDQKASAETTSPRARVARAR